MYKERCDCNHLAERHHQVFKNGMPVKPMKILCNYKKCKCRGLSLI